MALEIIELALQRAERERNNALAKMTRIENEFTGEEFKQLFIKRAEMAMIEHRTPGKFIIDESNKGILNLMFYYATRTNVDMINPTIGIVLAGKYGCGKSIMMSAFCKVLTDLVLPPTEKVEEIHAMALAEMIKKNGVMPYARKPLLIQDLGKEENIHNNYGTKMNPIGNLLAIRAEYGSLTFATTNYVWKSLDDHYTEYITTRMREHVTFLVLPGESRRKDFSKL